MAATFCRVLVDEWVLGGVTDVVIAPGSRSTPLVLALAAEPALRLHVHHDERSAGFMALGLGLAAGRPSVVVTTSGTAAVELHPAVVEAHQASVPMIACTADRPPELHDVGAPQTVDQDHLFGRAVRWFHQPGVPDWSARAAWRSLGARPVREALGAFGGRPGPVHVNLAFREPLVGTAVRDLAVAARGDGASWHRATAGSLVPSADDLAWVAPHSRRGRGVIIAGAGCDGSPLVPRLAALLGWPVLADPRSGLQGVVEASEAETGDAAAAVVVAAFDGVLRSQSFAGAHRPDVVLWLGERPASKVLGQWVAIAAAEGAVEMVVGLGRFTDPDHQAALHVATPVEGFCQALVGQATRAQGGAPAPVDGGWLDDWCAAGHCADATIEAVLGGHPEPTEPAVARSTAAALAGTGATLVASSSMPVRDLEWFARVPAGVRVLANRGANGIDGVVSTTVGVALAERAAAGAPTVCLIGDVAFLHDSNGLLGLRERRVDLTFVVIDNDGGGIFSFLPQASALPAERFERVFGTPHGVDLAGLAAVYGIPTITPAKADHVGPAVAKAVADGGLRMVLVRTERGANVAVHDELNGAISGAVNGMRS